MGHSGAGISWHIHFNSGGVGIYQLLNSLGGFTSMCPVLLASCLEGGGGIQEGVIAGGLDQAVAQGSWWFGIPGCGISALGHHLSPFPEMEMCPVVDTSTPEVVVYTIIRRN